MATPIDKIGFDSLAPTLRLLAKAGFNAGHMDWIRGGANEANARWLLAAIEEKMGTDAAQKRAAEEARLIGIINSGYTGEYQNERCKGPYRAYPTNWTPKSAVERGAILAPYFPGVDFSHVQSLAERYYANVPTEEPTGGYRAAPKNGRKLVLSEHADGGLLVVPKLGAAAKCMKKPKKSWHVSNIALQYILGVLKEVNPSFDNGLEGQIGPEYMRLLALTAKMLAKLDAETPGDVLVLPYQAGALFAGYSVRSSRGHMEALKLHIPADAFTNLCRAISDPESFESGSLVADCPGSERAPDADGRFWSAPGLWCVSGGGFKFCPNSVDDRGRDFGSTSLVLPASVPSE